MARIDLVLACVVCLAALRGAWRGFFRETFGFAALIGGIAAAFVFTPVLTARMRNEMALAGPAELHAAIAFVALFALTAAVLNTLGFLLERVMRGRLGNVATSIGGAVAGAAKGTVCAALTLLFVYLFVPHAAARLTETRLARHLIVAAGNGLRAGAELQPPAPPKDK